MTFIYDVSSRLFFMTSLSRFSTSFRQKVYLCCRRDVSQLRHHYDVLRRFLTSKEQVIQRLTWMKIMIYFGSPLSCSLSLKQYLYTVIIMLWMNSTVFIRKDILKMSLKCVFACVGRCDLFNKFLALKLFLILSPCFFSLCFYTNFPMVTR